MAEVMAAAFPPGSPEANLVHFAVMAVLSSDPARFARRLNLVQRQELRHIADELVQRKTEMRPDSDTGRHLISAADTAEILRVTARTVTRRAVQLGGTQIGGRWFFDKAYVLEKAREVNGYGA
ncbi:hypothetical protein GCM10010228_15260 [Streptomyces massasporeus]|nr:hypothetical protein GCM10010228_15260 [Streptomyces massasporeus]